MDTIKHLKLSCAKDWLRPTYEILNARVCGDVEWCSIALNQWFSTFSTAPAQRENRTRHPIALRVPWVARIAAQISRGFDFNSKILSSVSEVYPDSSPQSDPHKRYNIQKVWRENGPYCKLASQESVRVLMRVTIEKRPTPSAKPQPHGLFARLMTFCSFPNAIVWAPVWFMAVANAPLRRCAHSVFTKSPEPGW